MQGSKKSTQDMETDKCIESSVNVVNTLREVFSVSEKFIGKITFSRLIKKFLTSVEKLPKSVNKALIKDFVEFCSVTTKLPQANDLLTFEHLIYQVKNGIDNLPLDYLDMAKALMEMGDSVIFHLPKGSFLLHCQFPIIEFYDAVKNNKNLAMRKFQNRRNYFIIIWKQEGTLRCEYLETEEYNLLMLLSPSKPFVSIYDKFCQLHNESSTENLLPGLCTKGYINRFSVIKANVN